VEKALSHERKEEVRAFYAGLGGPARVGIEASGQSQWFERMLAELGHEVWIGDAAKIRASCERKQKTDRRDAELLLKLLAEDRFPRIWVPTAAERDGRQLLLHRHKLVRMRTQVKNQLQALALNQGVQRKPKLWSEAGRKQLESLPLLPWASRRRAELLQLLDQLGASITRTGPCGGRAGQCADRGTAIDDPSGRGTGHGAGLHAEDGTRGAFPTGQTNRQLPGADSQRVFQRRAQTAAGAHQRNPVAHQLNPVRVIQPLNALSYARTLQITPAARFAASL